MTYPLKTILPATFLAAFLSVALVPVVQANAGLLAGAQPIAATADFAQQPHIIPVMGGDAGTRATLARRLQRRLDARARARGKARSGIYVRPETVPYNISGFYAKHRYYGKHK